MSRAGARLMPSPPRGQALGPEAKAGWQVGSVEEHPSLVCRWRLGARLSRPARVPSHLAEGVPSPYFADALPESPVLQGHQLASTRPPTDLALGHTGDQAQQSGTVWEEGSPSSPGPQHGAPEGSPAWWTLHHGSSLGAWGPPRVDSGLWYPSLSPWSLPRAPPHGRGTSRCARPSVPWSWSHRGPSVAMSRSQGNIPETQLHLLSVQCEQHCSGPAS